MNMIYFAIVENETEQTKQTTEMIERYLKEKNVSGQIAAFDNGFDFLESKEPFDIVFMDIDMPGINGMETAMKMRKEKKEYKLIFVTNLPQYAIDGYKVEALDFILKPMTYADFSLAMKRAITSMGSREENSFALPIHGKFIKFKSNEVLYFEMVRHDVHLHLENGEEHVFRYSLSKIEEALNPEVFFKCNSGCIINLDKVKSLDGDTIVMENHDHVSISRSHRKDALSRLTDFYTRK